MKICSGVDLPEFKVKGGDVVTDESVKENPEESVNNDTFEQVVAAVCVGEMAPTNSCSFTERAPRMFLAQMLKILKKMMTPTIM